MTTDQPTAPKPKRRWYQYSLRTLMVVVTLFAVACSWFAVKLGQARRQREAVEALMRLKAAMCNVEYDYIRDSAGNLIPNAQSRGPAWLRNLLGIDFFCNVTEVWVGKKITDADLVHLKYFPKLRILFFNEVTPIYNPQVTDEGLKIVQGLTQLEVLGLSNTNITDAGLKYVKNLSRLQTLRLANTKITDAGLVNLKELTDLQFLDLESTRITDTGLEQLQGLYALKEIRLFNTKVGGDGVRNLQKALPKLKIELDQVIEL